MNTTHSRVLAATAGSLVGGATFAALVTLGAFFGVGPSLPLSAELRLTLGLLVVGVGYASMTLGEAMASARADASRESWETAEAESS